MPLRALVPLLVAVLMSAVSARGADEKLWLDLRSPEPDIVVSGPVGMVEVAGWAGVGNQDRHDLVIAIDVSISTGLPSGADVNGNGKVGRALRSTRDRLRAPNPHRTCSDVGDTVLAAEIAGVRRLVERLDLERTQVGLVTFSSGARVVAPLGSSREEIDAELDELASKMIPHGETNLAAAVRTSTRALFDGASADGQRPHRSLIILSDGTPQRRGRIEKAAAETLEAALESIAAGVRIHTFAIGVDIMEKTDVFAEISKKSGGHFVAIRDPGEIMPCLAQIRLTTLSDVAVRNATTGEPGRATRLFPDGSFDGVVTLAPGENRIAVVARGPTGSEQVAERVVVFEQRQPRDAAEARAASEQLARLRERTLETELALEVERGRTLGQAKRVNLALEPGG
jgi:uncharacterized protein YegL